MRKKQNQSKSNSSNTTKTVEKTRNTRGKGKGGQRFSSKDVGKEEVAASDNDVQWYAADPAILRDAASFPFSYPTGATNVHNLALYDDTHLAPYSQVPGICTLGVMPNLGFNLRATDPINVASQMVYSYVRHANSGHSNYDAPDLMLYILAMANCYSYLVWCERLYGYALSYDQRNRYIPNELIRLNNVDANDLRNNLANFRFWINTFIAKMSSFAVPATFSVFSRMTFLYSDFYVEGTSIKEQLYQFRPQGFYKFVIDSSSKGRLQWKPFDFSALMSVQDVINYGNDIFGSIWDQEDFGIMSGDILKSYGDRIIKLVSIPETYVIAPKFDPMVLTQIKNATMLEAEGTDISQSDEGLIVQVLVPRYYTIADKYFGTDITIPAEFVPFANNCRLRLLKDYKALTIDTDNPTPEVVMEATRLMYGYDEYLAEVRVGTEVVTECILTADVGKDYVFHQLEFADLFYAPTSEGAFFEASQLLKHFHYLPRITFLNSSVSNVVGIYEYFDLDNFTVLDNTDIAKLHQAAVINMYAVPSIGKIM